MSTVHVELRYGLSYSDACTSSGNTVAEVFRSLIFSELRELTIYCKWYIDDIAEYDMLVSAWQSMNYLKKIVVATLLPIKST